MELQFTQKTPASSGVQINEDSIQIGNFLTISILSTKYKDTLPTEFRVSQKDKQLIIEDTNTKDSDILLTGDIWGGFAGATELYTQESTADILWKQEKFKFSRGYLTVVAILKQNERLAVYTGELTPQGYCKSYIIYKNVGGTLIRQEIQCPALNLELMN